MLSLASLLAAATMTQPLPPPDACTAEIATRISFAEATAGREPVPCVSIDGIIVGRRFVADNAARYRREPVENDPSSTGVTLGFIGPDFTEPTSARVTGRLNNCAGLEAEGRALRPDSFIILTGYCQSHRGRVIVAAHVAVQDGPGLVRLLPAQAQPDLGDLAPLAEGVLLDAAHVALAAFLDAVVSGDRDRLAAMHGGGRPGGRDLAEVAAALALLTTDTASPFAALDRTRPIQIAVFGWKPPYWADGPWRAAAGQGGSDAIACFSARVDAAALWPIDSRDADNRPGRPYACTRIHIDAASGVASFETEQAADGVAEPSS